MEILSSRTILRPADYAVTLGFYRDTLGLAVAREYPGGTVLFAGQGLIEVAAHGGSDGPNRFSGALWLQVRDLTAAQTELVLAGVKIVREARQEPWGLHEMWITDPDGVPIVLVEIPADHPIRRDSRPAPE
ncbi:MAG: VOC family protein [Rhodococcus sp.]|nr:VOC family protein [Rhodococcus sp. (in: high G+C Gram-positive bacteria)]